MKLIEKTAVGVLSLILGLPALGYGQDDPKRQEEPRPEPKAQDQEKPPKQEQPKPESKQDEMRPPKEERPKPSQQQEAKPSPGHQGGNQAARPAAKSGHIPDKKFRASFGREHTVVINQPVIVEGQPRFQYSGYWFIISDPWPDGWAYTDECYIDYIDDQYFIFDLVHPGARVALIVVM